MMIPGEIAITYHTVRPDETALSWGGSAEVLASPVLIGKVEQACMAATDHLVEPGCITVGIGFDIQHRAPTPVGCRVEYRAELTEVNGRKLKYAVVVTDEFGLIARGTHSRAIVQKSEFLEKLQSRIAADGIPHQNVQA
ncbi:thioesterase family protein [Sinorhizobium meliloti]|uniref:thioesterase family protein n=1 Tax=Rhizobium meliloti TaxID=382 RepID=UPI003F176C4D